jgi:ubiquinone/menaquinone biosynthesis C-methylase UbiE
MGKRHVWERRPGAWAINEVQQIPTYEAALRHVSPERGDAVLDVGCGTGVFLRLCADRGAAVSGLDASEDLLLLARTRVPEADLRQGDLQTLPYEDDRFDLVTGFTSFFFAEDVVAALREAARVARPGAPVVIQVFGRPEDCDVLPGTSGWRPEIVEELVPEAGLTVERSLDISWAYTYDDDAALVEALPAGRAAALAHCRQPDGSYRVSNEWHIVIARASSPAR